MSITNTNSGKNHSTAVAHSAAKGVLNYAKYPRDAANMQQNDGRPGVGNFIAKVPSGAELKRGEIIVLSEVQNEGMALLDFNVRIGGALGASVKCRPAIIRYPDPAATAAARLDAADKSILHWLAAEMTPVAAGVSAELTGVYPITKTVEPDIETTTTEATGDANLLGYPVGCLFFIGLAITDAATAATAADVEIHAHYSYAVQTQRGV